MVGERPRQEALRRGVLTKPEKGMWPEPREAAGWHAGEKVQGLEGELKNRTALKDLG